jgi:hypothetical protein
VAVYLFMRESARACAQMRALSSLLELCVCTIYMQLQELFRMVQHSKVFDVSFENPFRPEDERQSRRSRKREEQKF